MALEPKDQHEQVPLSPGLDFENTDKTLAETESQE